MQEYLPHVNLGEYAVNEMVVAVVCRFIASGISPRDSAGIHFLDPDEEIGELIAEEYADFIELLRDHPMRFENPNDRYETMYRLWLHYHSKDEADQRRLRIALDDLTLEFGDPAIPVCLRNRAKLREKFMSAEIGGAMRSKILLLNSAVMPVLSGTYEVVELPQKGFITAVRSARADGLLESFIGYEQTAELISKWTGVDIPLNRAKADIVDGQTMLVMRLKYRPDTRAKGGLVQPANFEFAEITYREAREEEV